MTKTTKIWAICIVLCLLSFSKLVAQQEGIKYKEYTYSALFQMIDDAEDSVFRLENAYIKFDRDIDSLFKLNFYNQLDTTIRQVVDKKLVFNNVQFFSDLDNINWDDPYIGGLVGIRFTKDVILKNTFTLNISYCQFEQTFSYDYEQGIIAPEILNETGSVQIENSSFNFFSLYKAGDNLNNFQINLVIANNSFISQKTASETFNIVLINFSNFFFENNRIETNGKVSILQYDSRNAIDFLNNKIISNDIRVGFIGSDGKIDWKNNEFSSPFKIFIDELDKQADFDWESLKGKTINGDGFNNFEQKVGLQKISEWEKDTTIKSPLATYADSVRYYDANSFENEIALKGLFYEHYKSKYQMATANKVYIELKNFETERFRILYQQGGTFDAFFKWKINQFMKLFAAYGTEPAKAITMSVYVVIAFAFVYLFFPNYWDSHGKNRIIDRFRFFTKYMKKDAGMHEVYLEDKQPELMAAEDFKSYMQESKQEIPKFFINAALPLYRWSVAGTQSTSWFLSKIDILKGTWSKTEPSKKGFKTALLIAVFLIAITYDIFIKVLNALMLSINTFTTLGFGEIPIKGLPRYLAIIQGFIGWFMLTIFSVSLISQVLN